MLKLRTSAAALACLIFAACGRAPPGPGQPVAPAAAPASSPAVRGTAGIGAASAPAATADASRSLASGTGAPLITDSADGVHIEYRVYGHGDPAVVLIHGWACDAGYWRAQLGDLQAKYTTVTLDLAGHGGSGRNRTDWSLARYGEDVAAVARRISSARIILVGHAMGGPVALEAAPLIGERLIGIIGVDTFKSLGLPPPPPRIVERAVAPFRADFIGAMHRFVPTLFEHGADPSLVRKVTADMARQPSAIAIASLVSLNSMDYRALLPSVHVPIIAIDSDLGHAASAARIRRFVPSFREITLKGDDDFLMLDDPQHFNPILLREIDAMAQEPRHVGRGE